MAQWNLTEGLLLHFGFVIGFALLLIEAERMEPCCLLTTLYGIGIVIFLPSATK